MAFRLHRHMGMKPNRACFFLVGLVLGFTGCSHSALDRDPDAGGEAAAKQEAGMTCEELTQTARDRIAATLDTIHASMPCLSPADCTNVYLGVTCDPSCSRHLSSAGAKAMNDTLADLEGGICIQYQQQGCPFLPQLPCPMDLANTCIDGVCTLVP
jgi:hypothetical protein